MLTTLIGGALGGGGVWLLSLIIPKVMKMIASWIRGVEAPVVATLTSIDEKFENVTGINLPEWVHRDYDGAVTQGVRYAESMIGTDEFWDSVGFILKGKPALIGGRLANLILSMDWGKGFNQAIPPELKQVFGEAKEKMAVPQVNANIMAIPLEARPDPEQLVIDVKAKAKAMGKTIETPVTPEVKTSNVDIQKKIAETRKELDVFIAKG